MKKLFVLTIFILLFPVSSFSITEKDIFRNPPLPSSFDMAGRTMILQAKLANTRNVNNKLKLLILIDDKFLEVVSEDVRWDEFDRPTYDFKIYYPNRYIKYNFILDTFSSTGESMRYVSRNYIVERRCKLNAPSQSNDPVVKGFEESKNAERTLHVSEDVYNILKEFKEKYENKSF